MTFKGLTPWHMWGNSLVAHVDGGPGVPGSHNLATTLQLAKIAYGRPDTWKFFFSAKIIDVDVDLGLASNVQARYHLTTGIGRTQHTIQSFEVFYFPFTGFGNIGDQRYSCSVIGVDRTGVDPPTEAMTNIITEFPAQDIQLNVEVRYTGGPPVAQGVTLAVDAYFAPQTHIRPEWFDSIADFRGGEENGN